MNTCSGATFIPRSLPNSAAMAQRSAHTPAPGTLSSSAGRSSSSTVRISRAHTENGNSAADGVSAVSAGAGAGALCTGGVAAGAGSGARCSA